MSAALVPIIIDVDLATNGVNHRWILVGTAYVLVLGYVAALAHDF